MFPANWDLERKDPARFTSLLSGSWFLWGERVGEKGYKAYGIAG